MTDEELLAKGRALASQVVHVLAEVGISVVGAQPGSLQDDRRGGHYATANITLVGESAVQLARRLTGDPSVDSPPAQAVRRAFHQRKIGGQVTADERSENVGVTQLTEGVLKALSDALLTADDE